MRVLITGGGGFLGSHLVDRARRDRIEPFVARRRDHDLTEAGHVASAHPKFAPVPFREETLWDGDPEETHAPYGVGLEARIAWFREHRLAAVTTE